MNVPLVHGCPQRSEEGVRSLGAGVTGSYEPSGGYWDLNSGAVAEQQTLNF